jgi:hypothetical protein
MKFFLVNDGRVIDAKNKVEALKEAGYENIYWQGNNPYVQKQGVYPTRVFAIKYVPSFTQVINTFNN